MIELFLDKPIWGDNKNIELPEQRIELFDELEKVLWGLMISEGRSEARLWLCEAISSLSITSRDQCDLFMCLLRSKRRKRDLAAQVLQLFLDKRPREAGAILARMSHRLEKFFEGHPRRIMQWFSTFSAGGDSAHAKGAKALSQFAFVNRDICWEELEWRGKHGQSPAVVATKPHYFLDLNVQRTVENFLDNVPEFWSSKEFSESLNDGQILSVDRKYFLDFFMDLMYEDNLTEVWNVIDQFLTEESFSYLCQHLLIVLDERDLCALLEMLQQFLNGSKYPVNYDKSSYWLEILICKCGDQVSIDQLLLLTVLFNKGRQLHRLVHTEEAEEEKEKVNELVLRICRKTSEAISLAPIAKDTLRWKTTELAKWYGLLSWTLLYRLSKECQNFESWKTVLDSNKIGFRKSEEYGLIKHCGTSDDTDLECGSRAVARGKNKRKQKSRKKRKRSRDSDVLGDEELLDLDDSEDRFSHQFTSASCLISTDDYSTPWSLADLPEHLSKYCLREWIKQTFTDYSYATEVS